MSDRWQKKIIEHVGDQGYRPKKVRALARDMGIGGGEYGAFREAVKSLRTSGRLVLGAGDAVVLPEVGKTVVGKFRSNPRGFGFIIPDVPNAHGDLFVPEGDALDALTGDTVRASVSKRGQRDGKMLYRARIEEVLERGNSRFVGELLGEEGTRYVQPDGNTLHVPVFIADAGAAGARLGDQVVVEIVTYPSASSRAQGVIIEVLGERGKPGVDVISMIRQYQLPDEFDEKVSAEASRVIKGFDFERERSRREDLRKEVVITIDPPDARDFDDAISVRELDRGGWELGVHIADVPFFVRENSALDAEARLRGNSVYFPGKVLPMLPEVLSNGLCSLQENQPRLTKSAFIRYDGKGRAQRARVANTVIRSRKRLTYLEASGIMAGKTGGYARDVVALVKRMEALARRIEQRRLGEGMLTLDLPDVELVLDDDGKVKDAVPADDSYSHKVIEMFMIEANEAVARLLFEAEIPAMRRIHGDPDSTSLTNLSKYLRVLGYQTPAKLDRAALQKILKEVEGSPHSFAVNLAVLRSMQRAVYSLNLEGHFALGSEHYLHFTSPIRRYPDLTVHRLIDEYAKGGGSKNRKRIGRGEKQALTALAEQCSYTERRAEKAERELKEVKVLELLRERLGEEVQGVVTGVTQFGLFVRIEMLPIEGLVPLDDLPDDWWQFDQRGGRLVGERSGRQIRIGDLMTVRLAEVNLPARKLGLAYMTHQSVGATSAREPGKTGPSRGQSAKQPKHKAKTGAKSAARRGRPKGARHSKRRQR